MEYNILKYIRCYCITGKEKKNSVWWHFFPYLNNNWAFSTLLVTSTKLWLTHLGSRPPSDQLSCLSFLNFNVNVKILYRSVCMSQHVRMSVWICVWMCVYALGIILFRKQVFRAAGFYLFTQTLKGRRKPPLRQEWNVFRPVYTHTHTDMRLQISMEQVPALA